jgi:protein disulfide-isomerase
MMRHLLFFFLLGLAAQSCSQSPAPAQNAGQTPQPSGQATQQAAQTPQQAAPATPYASEKPGWLVDLDQAYELSKKSGKPILANFTGSDWCGWCKRLDASVFSTPKFQDWAKENVILLELDFPRRKQIPEKNRQQNAAMQQALQITGYPTIWVLTLDKDAATGRYNINPKGKTGYAPTPEEFIGVVDQYVKS